MNPCLLPIRRAAFAGFALAAGAALAQGTARVTPVPPVAAPAARIGLPAPAGLASPYPAGLNAGAGPAGAGRVTADPVSPTGGVLGGGGTARAVVTSPGAGVAVRTDVMGAAPADWPAGPRTAADHAGAFLRADTNADRDLTRLEARRVPLDDFAFDEMDRNGDGLLSRGEYDDATRGR